MLSAYERQLILFYLSNAASRFHHSFPGKKEALAEWVAENRDLLAFEDENEEPDEHQAGGHHEKEISAREWKHLRETLEKEHAAACEGERKDHTARLLQRLGREMDLAPEDIAILEILLRHETQPIFVSLIDSFESGRHYHRQRFFNVTHPILPCILGVPAGAFRVRFAADAPLVKSGLVSVDDDGDIEIVKRLLRLVSVPDDSDLDVCRLLLDAATPGELEWSDFDHVEEERDHIEKLVKGALSTGTPGVNILVYGPPGTGKTEFCKTLAAQLGANLYSVGEEDERGRDPDRRERLQELRLAQRLLAPGRGSILLFDEMEGTCFRTQTRAGCRSLRVVFSHLRVRRLQSVPKPAARTHTSTDAVDLKLRSGDLSHRPTPYDLCPRSCASRRPKFGRAFGNGSWHATISKRQRRIRAPWPRSSM